jgi:hypothetical protein
MTSTEVIQLAFTRNLSVDHITQADIDLSKYKYVDGYVTGYDETSDFYEVYCKPVIAYGVAVDIFYRIASEVTDRGVVSFTQQGTAILAPDTRKWTHREYARTRDYLIKKMLEEAKSEGIELVDDTVTVEPIYSYGDNTTRRNRI